MNAAGDCIHYSREDESHKVQDWTHFILFGVISNSFCIINWFICLTTYFNVESFQNKVSCHSHDTQIDRDTYSNNQCHWYSKLDQCKITSLDQLIETLTSTNMIFIACLHVLLCSMTCNRYPSQWHVVNKKRSARKSGTTYLQGWFDYVTVGLLIIVTTSNLILNVSLLLTKNIDSKGYKYLFLPLFVPLCGC